AVKLQKHLPVSAGDAQLFDPCRRQGDPVVPALGSGVPARLVNEDARLALLDAHGYHLCMYYIYWTPINQQLCSLNLIYLRTYGIVPENRTSGTHCFNGLLRQIFWIDRSPWWCRSRLAAGPAFV